MYKEIKPEMAKNAAGVYSFLLEVVRIVPWERGGNLTIMWAKPANKKHFLDWRAQAQIAAADKGSNRRETCLKPAF